MVAQVVVRNMPTGTITAKKDLVLSVVLHPTSSILAAARGIVRAVQELHGFSIAYDNNMAVMAIRSNKTG